MHRQATWAGSPELLTGTGTKEEMETAEEMKTAAETVQNTRQQSWPGSEGQRQSALPAPLVVWGGSPALLCSPLESDPPL